MNLFELNWMKTRSPLRENEGAGGAGGGDHEGGAPAPANDALTPLQRRLDTMAKQLETLTHSRQEDNTRAKLQQYESTLTSKIAEAESTVDAAEKALAEAHDNGEGIEIARAQRKLTEAFSELEKNRTAHESFKARLREAERREGGSGGAATSGGTEADTGNLQEWKSRNASWYGVDTEMTKAAHAVDGRIREAGAIPIGSPQYFEAIDRAMKQQFPDRFGGTPPTSASSGGNSQGSGSRKGRVPQGVADAWRRMGLDMNDPNVVERMVKNRERAVNKGILPQDPVQGEVVSR